LSQRNSEYSRIAAEKYYTPPWVVDALAPYLPQRIKSVWEPACGDGRMAKALRKLGLEVKATDLDRGKDFLIGNDATECVITNPPFNQERQFIEHALKVTKPHRGFVAMLARINFDAGKTRAHLFGDCPQYAKKLVLTRRIVWFDRPGAAPSENHCWLMWDWLHNGPPEIAYYYEGDRRMTALNIS
jgi:hypothetical protein